MKKQLIIMAAAVSLLCGCKPDAVVPAEAASTEETAAIYPDYRGVTVPPNIAPLNVQVTSEGEEFVADVSGKGGRIVAAAGQDGKLSFDPDEWHSLLEASKGDSLNVVIYARRSNGWTKFPAYAIHVAEEPIDRYLSYRLIEPGYELYRQMGIYQRDLSTFDEQPVYENNRTFDSNDNHCVNCHHFQNHDASTMLFHVRAQHGGTVISEGGRLRRATMKTDSTLASAVYPAWHPSKPYIVFSSNQTGQAFHMINPQKVEVVDYGSDLVFYDVKKNTLTNILKTDGDLETFPCWSADGKRLYYCRARTPYLQGQDTDARIDSVLAHYKDIRYDLMSMAFDEPTRRFGQPVVELAADSIGKSATLPRVSPDGRYLLFTLGDYGQFHIWHKSSDLYVKDLRTGEVRALTEANSNDVDSYHTWSSNGRWIVFSSRRDDGQYTRPYIAYFDQTGRARKAFLLPQQDPEQNLLLLKSYNIPELTRNPVSVTPEELKAVVYGAGSERTTYAP